MNNLLKIKCKKDGVTLVEILVAITIAAFAFLPIMKIFTYSTRNSQKFSNYATARELAAKTMDELLSLDFDQLTAGNILNIPIRGIKFPRIEKKGNVKFSLKIKIEDITPSFHVRQKNIAGVIGPEQDFSDSYADLKKITVTVSWKGISSVQKYELQSLKADLFK